MELLVSELFRTFFITQSQILIFSFGYTFFIAINHQDLKSVLKWEMMSLKTDDNWSYMKT